MANRLTEISTMDHQLQWHHIPTTLNPADHGTRGLEPREINEKWLTPPTFLKQPKYLWHDNTLLATTVVAAGFQRQTKHKKLSLNEPIFDIRRFSTWNKLILTLTTVMSFISKLQIRILKRKTNQNPSSGNENERILCNTSDVEKAKLYAIKICQAQSFPNTIKKLENKSKIDNKD